jgi:hypothetical protein
MKTEWNEGYEKGYADALGMLNLTDEEIMECFKEVNLFTANMVDVARAILRKAQEK